MKRPPLAPQCHLCSLQESRGFPQEGHRGGGLSEALEINPEQMVLVLRVGGGSQD